MKNKIAIFVLIIVIYFLQSCSSVEASHEDTADYKEVTITNTERGTVFKYAKVPGDNK